MKLAYVFNLATFLWKEIKAATSLAVHKLLSVTSHTTTAKFISGLEA